MTVGLLSLHKLLADLDNLSIIKINSYLHEYLSESDDL